MKLAERMLAYSKAARANPVLVDRAFQRMLGDMLSATRDGLTTTSTTAYKHCGPLEHKALLDKLIAEKFYVQDKTGEEDPKKRCWVISWDVDTQVAG